jgi:phospholipase C
VKAKAYQDGHAGYSDPIDEQDHLVSAVNAVIKSAYWNNAAIIITYDDSDGWYDHVMPVIIDGSVIPGIDALNGPGRCGDAKPNTYSGRCGYGPRLPLLVISPYARVNAVDHTLTDQTSIIRFIEDNWSLGRIGNQSRDVLAGPLDALFDFRDRAIIGLARVWGRWKPSRTFLAVSLLRVRGLRSRLSSLAGTISD